MGRKPFRSRYGLSGPQPTFTAQGKAPSSGWGVRRAAAGKGSVSREGAFPEAQGAKLVPSSDIDLDSDDDPLPRKRRRVTAATSAAQLARSTAAETRALHPAPLALDLLDSSDLDIKAVVSAHESDLEPDSDDPDRDSTRVARAKAAKRAAAAPAPAAGPSRDRGEDLQSEMRRLRAEAAARRVERSKVVEVLDSDEEERALEAEQEQLAAGPNLVRAPAASGKAAAGAAQDKGKGKGKGKGRKGKKGAQAKGRTLDEPSDEGDDAALKGLEAFKRSKKAGTAAAAPRASTSRAKGKSKAKDNIALFNPASDDDNLDSDGSLPSLADLQQRTEPRRPPPPRPRIQPCPSTSKPLDARAQRRARTSGRSADAFINNSDDEREADRWGGGTVIATGGSGSGTVRLRGVRSRGRRLEERVEEEEEDEQDEPPPPRRRRARSASGSPAAQASPPTQDYSHLGIAPFVDPRAALARRKMRDEMSSPPTSAFSSSDGECDDDVDDDSSAARRRKKKKGAADEFVELDKHMKRRKRQFRDERQPGYSNPRRN